MPSGPRIRTDNVYGTVSDNPLTNAATTMNSAGLANLAAVSSAHAVIILDPLRAAGAPEAVIVTAHTGSATAATITRGAYGTAARQHAAGTLWVHAPTVEDVIRIVTSSTRPTDPYEGQIAYETDTNRWIGYDGSAWQPSPHNPPACQVTHNTTQALADSTETTLTFNSERYDPDSMHDTSTNPSRITITTAGLYLITFNGQLAAGTDYTMVYGYVRLNGTTAIAQAINGTVADSGSAGPTLMLAKPWKLSAGNYIEMRVFQNNGANASRNMLSSSTFSPDFAATWVGVG